MTDYWDESGYQPEKSYAGPTPAAPRGAGAALDRVLSTGMPVYEQITRAPRATLASTTGRRTGGLRYDPAPEVVWREVPRAFPEQPVVPVGPAMRQYNGPMPGNTSTLPRLGRPASAFAGAAAVADQAAQVGFPERANMSIFGQGVEAASNSPFGAALGLTPGEQKGGSIEGPFGIPIATAPITIANAASWGREGLLALLSSAANGTGRYEQPPGAMFGQQVAGPADEDKTPIDYVIDGANAVGDAVWGVFDGAMKWWRDTNASNRGAELRQIAQTGAIQLTTGNITSFFTAQLVGGDRTTAQRIAAAAVAKGETWQNMAAKLYDLDPRIVQTIMANPNISDEELSFLTSGQPLSTDAGVNILLELGLQAGMLVAGGLAVKSLQGAAMAPRVLGLSGVARGAALATKGIDTLWRINSAVTLSGWGVRGGELAAKEFALLMGNQAWVDHLDKLLWEMPLSTNPGLNLIDGFGTHILRRTNPITGEKGWVGSEILKGDIYAGEGKSAVGVSLRNKTIILGEKPVEALRVAGIDADIPVPRRTGIALSRIDAISLDDIITKVTNKIGWEPEAVRAVFGDRPLPDGSMPIATEKDLKNALLYQALSEVRDRAGDSARALNPAIGLSAFSAEWVTAHIADAAKLLENAVTKGDTGWLVKRFREMYWNHGTPDGSEIGMEPMYGDFDALTSFAQFRGWTWQSKFAAEAIAKAKAEGRQIATEDWTLALAERIDAPRVQAAIETMNRRGLKPNDPVPAQVLNQIRLAMPSLVLHPELRPGPRKGWVPRMTRGRLEEIMGAQLKMENAVRATEQRFPQGERPPITADQVEAQALPEMAKAAGMPEDMVKDLMPFLDDTAPEGAVIPESIVKWDAAQRNVPLSVSMSSRTGALLHAMRVFEERLADAQIRGGLIVGLEDFGNRIKGRPGAAPILDSIAAATESLQRPPRDDFLARQPAAAEFWRNTMVEALDYFEKELDPLLDDPVVGLQTVVTRDRPTILPPGANAGTLEEAAMLLDKLRTSVTDINDAELVILSDPLQPVWEKLAVLHDRGLAMDPPLTVDERGLLERMGKTGPELFRDDLIRVAGEERDFTAADVLDLENKALAMNQTLADAAAQVEGYANRLSMKPGSGVANDVDDFMRRARVLGEDVHTFGRKPQTFAEEQAQVVNRVPRWVNAVVSDPWFTFKVASPVQRVAQARREAEATIANHAAQLRKLDMEEARLRAGLGPENVEWNLVPSRKGLSQPKAKLAQQELDAASPGIASYLDKDPETGKWQVWQERIDWHPVDRSITAPVGQGQAAADAAVAAYRLAHPEQKIVRAVHTYTRKGVESWEIQTGRPYTPAGRAAVAAPPPDTSLEAAAPPTEAPPAPGTGEVAPEAIPGAPAAPEPVPAAGAAIQAAYDAGNIAEGQRLNVAEGIARGGTAESGGAVKPSTVDETGFDAAKVQAISDRLHAESRDRIIARLVKKGDQRSEAQTEHLGVLLWERLDDIVNDGGGVDAVGGELALLDEAGIDIGDVRDAYGRWVEVIEKARQDLLKGKNEKERTATLDEIKTTIPEAGDELKAAIRRKIPPEPVELPDGRMAEVVSETPEATTVRPVEGGELVDVPKQNAGALASRAITAAHEYAFGHPKDRSVRIEGRGWVLPSEEANHAVIAQAQEALLASGRQPTWVLQWNMRVGHILKVRWENGRPIPDEPLHDLTSNLSGSEPLSGGMKEGEPLKRFTALTKEGIDLEEAYRRESHKNTSGYYWNRANQKRLAEARKWLEKEPPYEEAPPAPAAAPVGVTEVAAAPLPSTAAVLATPDRVFVNHIGLPFYLKENGELVLLERPPAPGPTGPDLRTPFDRLVKAKIKERGGGVHKVPLKDHITNRWADDYVEKAAGRYVASKLPEGDPTRARLEAALAAYDALDPAEAEAHTPAALAIGVEYRAAIKDAQRQLWPAAQTAMFEEIPRTNMTLGRTLGTPEEIPVGRGKETGFPDPYDETKTIPATFRVVELDDLISSDQPGYRTELQPRDRAGRKASDEQVVEMARKMTVEPAESTALMLRSESGAEGVLVTDPSLNVIAGNGRTMALRQAGAPMTAAMKEALVARAAEFGIDPAAVQGMKRPVLVREVPADIAGAQLAGALNVATGGMALSETAARVAREITPADVGAIDFGRSKDLAAALDTAEGISFAKRILGKLTQREQAQFLTPQGGLNRQGVDLVQAALMSKLMRDPAHNRIVTEFFETPDTDVGRIRNGLLGALKPLLEAHALIETGNRFPNLAIGDSLGPAIDQLINLRGQALNATEIRDVLSSPRMFESGDDAFARELALVLHTAKSQTEITEFFTEYANAVKNSEDPTALGMFGAPTALPKWQIANNALKEINGRRMDAAAKKGGMGLGEVEVIRPFTNAEGDAPLSADTMSSTGVARPPVLEHIHPDAAAAAEDVVARVEAQDPQRIVFDDWIGNERMPEGVPVTIRTSEPGWAAILTSLRSGGIGEILDAFEDYIDGMGDTLDQGELLMVAKDAAEGNPAAFLIRQQIASLSGKSPRVLVDGTIEWNVPAAARLMPTPVLIRERLAGWSREINKVRGQGTPGGLMGESLLEIVGPDDLPLGTLTQADAVIHVAEPKEAVTPEAYEAVTGLPKDTLDAELKAEALDGSNAHVVTTDADANLAAALKVHAEAVPTPATGRSVLEFHRPDEVARLERLEQKRIEIIGRMTEAQRIIDEANTPGALTETTSVPWNDPEIAALWARFAQTPTTDEVVTRLAFGEDFNGPPTLGSVMAAVDSIDKQMYGDLTPAEAQQLRMALMDVAERTLAKAGGESSPAAQARRDRMMELVKKGRAHGQPAPEVVDDPAVLPAALDDLASRLAGRIEAIGGDPIDGFTGYQLGILPRRSKFDRSPLTPRIQYSDLMGDYKDLIDQANAAVPGLGDDLLAGPIRTLPKRIEDARFSRSVVQMVDLAFGPRHEKALSGAAKDRFLTMISEIAGPSVDIKELDLDIKAIISSIHEWMQIGWGMGPFKVPIHRRLSTVSPAEWRKLAVDALKVRHSGELPAWWTQVDMQPGGIERVWLLADNRFREWLRQSKPGLLTDLDRFWYKSSVGRHAGELKRDLNVLYNFGRFILDARWHALEFIETDALLIGRDGLTTYRRFAKMQGGTRGLGTFQGSTPGPSVMPPMWSELDRAAARKGWAWWASQMEEIGVYGRARDNAILAAMKKESPQELERTLLAWAKQDPILNSTLKTFGETPDQWLDRLVRDWQAFDAITDPRAWARLKKGGRAKLLSQFDEVKGKAGALAEKDAYPGIPEIERAIGESRNDPRVVALYERLREINNAMYDDLAAVFYGQPDRSNFQRLLNHPLLYWPISYQIKATKWLARVMFDSAFGVDTGAGGAVILSNIHDRHIERYNSDPEYRKWFEQHKTLLFIGQMLLPITPFDIGVSLAPWTRIALNMANGDDYSRNVFSVGPGYTYFSLLPRLFFEENKAGGLFNAEGPLGGVGDIGETTLPLTIPIRPASKSALDQANADAIRNSLIEAGQPIPETNPTRGN